MSGVPAIIRDSGIHAASAESGECGTALGMAGKLSEAAGMMLLEAEVA
jgi:hypothetical protein